jgi:quercetin dioxygenase-like cupin family protein
MQVKFAQADGVFFKQMSFNKGGFSGGHSHDFHHITLLAQGSLRVVVDDGVAKDFKAPQLIFIAAGKVHDLIALEDNTVAYCISRTGPGGSGKIRDYPADVLIDETMEHPATVDISTAAQQ